MRASRIRETLYAVAMLKESCDFLCMATQADVRRIAMALPNVEEAKDRFAFSVLNKGKLKGFAWVWLERISPKAARVPNPKVLAVRVANVRHRLNRRHGPVRSPVVPLGGVRN